MWWTVERANAVTGGIWLIGLGVLFATGYWWPGILFLVGVTAMVEGSARGSGWQSMHGGLWLLLIACWAMMRFNLTVFFVALGVYVDHRRADEAESVPEAVRRSDPGMTPTAAGARERTTMTKALLPQAFWFRIAVSCPRVEEMPLPDRRQRLLDLPASCILPEGARLEGRTPWAEVRVGWNPRGLGVVVRAEGLGDPKLAADRPEGFADCPALGGHARHPRREPGDAVLPPLRGRDPIASTRASPSSSRSPRSRSPARSPTRRWPGAATIESRADLDRNGWTLEVFLPAQVLNGFDPETNRRLGFAYQVSDHLREDQFLGVGRDFPIGENPSLWSTIELKD